MSTALNEAPLDGASPAAPYADVVARLDLDQKCAVVAGASSLRTTGFPELGVPQLKMSDGPNGVSGEGQGTTKTPTMAMPVGIAMGASWDPELVGRVADAIGAQAERWGVHALLGPTVNLQRTPIGGRVFECFSEDPELTSALAVAYVRAVQQRGVAAVVKHFACNDTEAGRYTVDVHVDERPLRELYLRPFEDVVALGGAWGVMSAYNRVRGAYCSANEYLLRDVLRGEWGFDGAVVSDWFGTNDTAGMVRAGLSIEMPGPPRWYGAKLAQAVRDGVVEEAQVDRLVVDVLRLAERTGAATRPASTREAVLDDSAERSLAREAAIAGTVLLRNEDVLPVVPGTVAKLAVIGPNADDTRIMGGGSSAVRPLPTTSILEALQARFGVDNVVHEPGVRIDRLTPLPGRDAFLGPDGEPGLLLSYSDGHQPASGNGVPAKVQRLERPRFHHLGSAPVGIDPNAFTGRMHGAYVPEVDGPHTFGVVVAGGARVVVNGETIVSPETELPKGFTFFGMGSEELLCTVEAEAGRPIDVDVQVLVSHGFGGARLGVRRPDAPDMFERAVAAAADVDVAVVVVGTTEEWESEGEDRTTIDLPGRQDELVRRVAEASSRTVVVINAGAPVAMPWVDDVGAVVVPFFGGVETGEAVADVLTGAAEPGGRLPITWPRRLEDTPAWPYYHQADGRQTYGEGLFVGYRGFEAAGTEPLFPFGHGLGYGAVEWGRATLRRPDPEGCAHVLRVPLVNRSERPTTAVVQIYVAPVDPPVPRPAKELKAFAKVAVPPGGAVEAEVALDYRAFRRWDERARAWTVDDGEYELVIAASATDEVQRIRTTLGRRLPA